MGILDVYVYVYLICQGVKDLHGSILRYMCVVVCVCVCVCVLCCCVFVIGYINIPTYVIDKKRSYHVSQGSANYKSHCSFT
jgi:hypothetical protein